MKKIISFQIDVSLLSKLDENVKKGCGNRSETLRQMVMKILEDKSSLNIVSDMVVVQS